jgi:hypothetical protein
MAGLWYITNDAQKWQQVMGKQIELDSLHGITYKNGITHNQNEVRHTSTGSSTETVTNIVT